jgi:hypothetical protein
LFEVQGEDLLHEGHVVVDALISIEEGNIEKLAVETPVAQMGGTT